VTIYGTTHLEALDDKKDEKKIGIGMKI